MPLTTSTILGPVIDHALSLGVFDSVAGHEPKRAPGNGITLALWIDRITPITSGLASTSARVVVIARAYGSMLAEPQDAIDPRLSDAASALVESLVGDFELGGVARSVDVRGIHGVPLDAQAGYIEQDSRLFRVFTVTIPVLLNDVWTEVA